MTYLHAVEPDSRGQLVGQVDVHGRRWRRPCPSDEILLLCRVLAQLVLETRRTEALESGKPVVDADFAVSGRVPWTRQIGPEKTAEPAVLTRAELAGTTSFLDAIDGGHIQGGDEQEDR